MNISSPVGIVAAPARFLRILSAAAALVVTLGIVVFPGVVAPFDRLEYDLLFRHAHTPPSVDPRLVVVEIDDATLQRMKTFPVGRDEHARMAERLAGVGVRAAVWDLLFDLPGPSDASLAAAFGRLPTILAVSARPSRHAVEIPDDVRRFAIPPEPDAPPELPPFEVGVRPIAQLEASARGMGHVWASVDPDGICRRIPLVVRVGDRWLPSLALAGALPLLGIGVDAVHVLPGSRLRLDVPSAPIEIPLDADGTILVDYVADWRKSLDVRSYEALSTSLEDLPEEMRPGLEGKLVLIGETETGSGDFVATPHERSLPGVLVTASLLNEILSRRFLRTASAWTSVAVALALVGFVLFSDLIGGPIASTLGSLLALIALLAATSFSFSRSGTFVPVSLPLAAVAAASGVLVGGSLSLEHRRARRLSEMLSRFVSPVLLRQFETRPESALRPRREELTILFVDLEGFTDFTESQEPEVVSSLLARFYEMAMDELFHAGGTLDEFKGDGVLAYFGAPKTSATKEIDAIRAAVAIRKRFGEIDRDLRARGLPSLGIRCGVSSGYVSVGYFGGERFASYGVVGRSVNLAARIQALAERDQILVDSPTAAHVKEAFTLRPIPPVHLKGIQRDVELWGVEA